MDAAKATRKNLISKIAAHLDENSLDEYDSFEWKDLYQKLSQHMADDLDTVSVLSTIYGSLENSESAVDILLFDGKVTKLWLKDGVQALMVKSSVQAPAEIITLADQRLEAKEAKEYDRADQLRDQISAAWWIIKDVAGGYELVKE